jgi:hypothetical protein
MLNIRANDQHLTVALNPKSIRSTRVIVPLTGDFSFHIVDGGGEVPAGIFDLQKFKLGPHLVQLHRKVLRLQGHLKDFSQIADGLVLADREYRDFLLGIIRRGEEGKTLEMIPMKVSERDGEQFLVVSNRAHVPAEIAKPRSGVNNDNAIRIPICDLKTGGVATEVLEASITDWDGAAGPVKFELHAELYRRVDARGKLGVKKWT